MNEDNMTGTALEEKQEVKPEKGEAKATPPTPAKPKKKKSKAGRIIAIIVVLAILAAGSYIVVTRLTKKSGTSVKYTEATVMRGDIAKTITGSGAVQPVQEYTVVPTVTGLIVKDNITQGQKINKGDLIYGIDPTNANNAIQQNQNSLQRAQLTYTQSAQAVANLTVTSDISGVVTKVYVKNGDQVNTNSPVVDVVDTSNLLLTIPFNAADAANIAVGTGAQVTLEATGAVLPGTVSRVYSGQQIGANGAIVTNIDIKLSNPGVIQSGTTATAVVGGKYACNAAGTFAFVAQKTVTAKTSGQVSGLTLQAGDAIDSGDTVARLVNDQTVTSEQTAKLQVDSAQLQLQNAQDALKNYNLTSPISGTVIEKNMKAGDTISNTSSTNSMAVIADMTSLVMTINVDELDILSIKIGQTVNITADAQPGKTFTGSVTNISIIGNSGSSTTSTGVTTYAVQITVSDYGSLLPGMNVNASIVVNSSKNTLLIPEQAVLSGGFVMRKISGTSGAPAVSGAPATASSSTAPTSAPSGGSGQAGASHNGGGQTGGGKPSGSNTAPGTSAAPGASMAPGAAVSPGTSGAPAASGGTNGANSAAQNRMKQLQASLPVGYEVVRVTIGLTDGVNAEVTSGLNEGDIITFVTPAKSTGTNNNAMMFGGSAARPATGGGSSTTVVRPNTGGSAPRVGG